MYCFKRGNIHYGILFHDDIIFIFEMRISYDYYYGIHIINDKLDELVDALNQINTGVVSSATVAGGSPIWQSGKYSNADTDIIVSKSNNWLNIESGLMNGNKIQVVSNNGIGLQCNYLPDLIQALKGVSINGAFDVDHFIKHDINHYGMPCWIIVLKFDDCVVLFDLNSANFADGMRIPNSKISAVSKKLFKKYDTHIAAVSQGIDVNTDFCLIGSGGDTAYYLPSAEGALFVALTLSNIKKSQQP